VVDDITGVVKEVPEAMEEPPVLAVYQLMVPELAVAPSVTAPLPQAVPPVVEVIAGPLVTTVATTAVLVGDTQVPSVPAA